MVYGGSTDFGGLCRGCNHTSPLGNTRKADCLRCGNHTWNGTYVDENSLGTCNYCTGTVSEDGKKCIKE